MVTVTKSTDGTVAIVSGDSSDVMLFFCVWQTVMWPNWMRDTSKTKSSLAMHKTAVKMIRGTGMISLYDASRVFEDACKHAIGQCKALGVEVNA